MEQKYWKLTNGDQDFVKDYVIFNLAKHAPKGYPDKHPQLTLYEQIKQGLKTIEYRYATEFWCKRLINNFDKCAFSTTTETIEYAKATKTGIDLTLWLKSKNAWFVTGYPKDSLPRLEAKITRLVYYPKGVEKGEFHIHISSVTELTESGKEASR